MPRLIHKGVYLHIHPVSTQFHICSKLGHTSIAGVDFRQTRQLGQDPQQRPIYPLTQWSAAVLNLSECFHQPHSTAPDLHLDASAPPPQIRNPLWPSNFHVECSHKGPNVRRSVSEIQVKYLLFLLHRYSHRYLQSMQSPTTTLSLLWSTN